MRGNFGKIAGKTLILRILMVFVILTLGITGHLTGVEGALRSRNRTVESGFGILTESEAEEVREIWRVIGDQEVVSWDGKEWLAKTESQKREAIEKVCEAWQKAGYQDIESVEYFVEDIDKYYRHHEQKNPKEGLKTKVGLVLGLSAFFSGIEILQE